MWPRLRTSPTPPHHLTISPFATTPTPPPPRSHQTRGFASSSVIIIVPPQGRSGEGRTVIYRGCGARRSTHHDWTASRQSPVIHARGRAGVRGSPAAGWHGFADVSCPIVAPGPHRRQPALACALGRRIRDEHRIRSSPTAGITSSGNSWRSVNIAAEPRSPCRGGAALRVSWRSRAPRVMAEPRSACHGGAALRVSWRSRAPRVMAEPRSARPANATPRNSASPSAHSSWGEGQPQTQSKILPLASCRRRASGMPLPARSLVRGRSLAQFELPLRLSHGPATADQCSNRRRTIQAPDRLVHWPMEARFDACTACSSACRNCDRSWRVKLAL